MPADDVPVEATASGNNYVDVEQPPVCDPRFAELLRGLRRNHVAAAEDPDTAFGLWSDLSLAYQNPQWFQFAAANGAPATFARDWPLGRSILDAIPTILRSYYREGYVQCLTPPRRPVPGAGGVDRPHRRFDARPA